MTGEIGTRWALLATLLIMLALGGCATGPTDGVPFRGWRVDAGTAVEDASAWDWEHEDSGADDWDEETWDDEDTWDEPDAGPIASSDGGEPPDSEPSCNPALCPGLRCVEDACGYYPDCRELLASGLALASQDYWIRPVGASAPFTAHCDMSTDGGGWTLVFLAREDDYDRTLTDYSEEGARAILAGATEALLAFRAFSLGRPVTPGTPWARVELPAEWQTAFPTAFSGEQRTVMTLVEGEAAPSPRELVFGYGEFRTDVTSGGCETEWQTWDVDYGRICVRGTQAPFYSATHSGDPDRCATSDQAWNETRCSTTRRFSIAVR